VIVDELGLLIGPAVFVVNDSTEVYVRQKMQRSFWSYIRRGWPLASLDQPTVSQQTTVTEVREREAHNDISSEETTSQHSAVRSQRLRHSSALRASS